MTAHPSYPFTDRRGASPLAAQTSAREIDCLEFTFDQLNPMDGALLIQVIAKIVEIERIHGEEVALAMLDRSMIHDGDGRRIH
jgi:hypothetical protein